MTTISNPTAATQSKRQEDLNLSHCVSKSSHGGKRAGAGRPSSGRDHRDWRLAYLEKYAHPLIHPGLTGYSDYEREPEEASFCGPKVRPHFLTIHQAYKLCCMYRERGRWERLYPSHEGQLLKLLEKHRDVLERYVRQNKNGAFTWAVEIAEALLEAR